MNKEELKQEAEQDAGNVSGLSLSTTIMVSKDKTDAYRLGRFDGYLLGAEPREKRIAELEKENKVLAQNLEDTEILNKTYEKRFDDLEKENTELKSIAEFQQSSNMSRHFENKKLKEGLAVGSTFNKALNSMNKNLEEERDKYRNMVFDKDEQLTTAKELLKWALHSDPEHDEDFEKKWSEAEQFLKETK